MTENTALENDPPAIPDGVHQFEQDEQISSITFKDGKKHGPMYVFERGVLSTEMMFESDVLNGIMKYYYPNKALQLQLNFLDGKQDGDFIQYHPNGAIQMQMQYKNGQKQGICKIYDAYGNLLQDMFYINDLLDGPVNSYYEDKLVARKYYKDGVEVIT